MRNAAIDDVRLADAGAKGIEARFNFRDHAAVDDAITYQLPAAARGGWGGGPGAACRHGQCPECDQATHRMLHQSSMAPFGRLRQRNTFRTGSSTGAARTFFGHRRTIAWLMVASRGGSYRTSSSRNEARPKIGTRTSVDTATR